MDRVVPEVRVGSHLFAGPSALGNGGRAAEGGGMDEKARPRPSLPSACPGCGSTRLEPVTTGGWTNMLCHRCGSCWRLGLRTTRVDPLTCPGCSARRICMAALAERSP